jgi:hypothetical protein
MLLQYGLISKKKVNDIQQDSEVLNQEKKSRWVKAAERFREEDYLAGRSGEVKSLFREFREDFGDSPVKP